MKPGTYIYCFPILLSAQGSFLLDCYANQPAFWEEEDGLAYSFQFLYLVSRWNPASMGNIHLHQDSGPWPVLQAGLEGSQGWVSTHLALLWELYKLWQARWSRQMWGSRQGSIKASQPRTPGKPSMQRPSALCSRSCNPVTRMGVHLALH